MTGNTGWLVVAVGLLAAGPRADADSVVNGAFDKGDVQPVGWRVGSGAGTWERLDDNAVLISRGSAEQTSFWRSDAVGFVPAGLYRLSFRARRLQGSADGTVMSGTAFANRDLGPLGSDWQHFSSFFAVPDALKGRDWLRFGQWHLPGAVAFDDVRLDRVEAVHHQGANGVQLGQGERIAGSRYEFQAPQRTALGNYSRPLHAHLAGFNTNRWVFGDGDWVHYRHAPGGLLQTSGRVTVNVNYHTGGALIVEARTDSLAAWIPMGTVDGVRGATFQVPARLLPATSVAIRLRAKRAATSVGSDADPGSFQVDGYSYEATLAGQWADAEGSTRLVVVENDAGVDTSIRIVRTGDLQPGLADTFELQVTGAMRRAGLKARIFARTGDGSGQASSGPAFVPLSIPPTGRVQLPYRLMGRGSQILQVDLASAQGPVWHAELDVRASILHADHYGELLASSAGADSWWASSGWKVSATRQAPTTKGATMRIEAARNEAEAAQLVLRPRQTLRDLVVRTTDLRGPNGTILPAQAVDLLRVGTVPVQQPTDLTGEAAAWPDPLLPLDGPLHVPADRNLVLWVRITTPRGIPAGDYHGHIVVSATGWSQQVNLLVTVFDVELPDRMTCQTAFGFNPTAVWRYHRLQTEADRRQVLDLYLQSFARHHISPYDPAPLDRPVINWPHLDADAEFAADATVEPRVDWSAWDVAMERAIDTYHFNSFRLNMPGMGGGTYINRREPELQGWAADTPQYGALFRGYGRAVQRHLSERGWLDEAYVYWFDEPAPRDYDFVMDGFARLQAAAPGVTRMLTEQVEAELTGGPNLWCPVTPSYDAESSAARRQAGDRFWWYVCTVPKAPWAGLFIDHAGTDLRVWLWQTWQNDMDGILVWATNYWTSAAAYPDGQQNPYEDPMSWESVYNAPVGTRRPWGNGDGRFLYPPLAVFDGDGPVLQGPVESIRWEMLRDGIEDYEYLAMLRRALHNKEALLEDEERDRWTSLLDVPPEISAGMTDFSVDPAPIEARRREVARALEQLARR